MRVDIAKRGRWHGWAGEPQPSRTPMKGDADSRFAPRIPGADGTEVGEPAAWGAAFPFDRQRVRTLSAAIAGGRYAIDLERVAERLQHFESLLADVLP